jgi:hypothetical protein
MNAKTLNEAGRQHVRELIDASHVADVIDVCEDYCREQAKLCNATKGMKAIAGEWALAAALLAQAAAKIEP